MGQGHHDEHDHDHECCRDGQGKGGGCCKGEGGGGCCAGSARAPLDVRGAEEMSAMEPVSLIMRYRRGIECIDRRVLSLTERQIDAAFLPDAGVGRWPVRVLIGHVADADLASVHRMRRIVAEDHPVFAEWDENAFIDANVYGHVHEGYADDPEADHARVMSALGGHLAVVHTLRQWAGQWLLSLEPDALERTGLHPTLGEQSVRQILAYYTWHLEHHARFLTLKLDRMLGPAPAENAPPKTPNGHSGYGCACGADSKGG